MTHKIEGFYQLSTGDLAAMTSLDGRLLADIGVTAAAQREVFDRNIGGWIFKWLRLCIFAAGRL